MNFFLNKMIESPLILTKKKLNSIQLHRIRFVFNAGLGVCVYDVRIEIGAMKSLETLNVCKNRLTQIPVELAASTSITELFASDNDLHEIPTKIMAMENLRILEAERKFLMKAIFNSKTKNQTKCNEN